MSLGDPFSSTMQTTFAGATKGQDAAMGGVSAVADVMQKKNTFNLLKQLGVINTTPPSTKDLAQGLKDAGSKAGYLVDIDHIDDTPENKSKLIAAYKGLGIPLPKPRVTLLPGTSIDDKGGFSYTAQNPKETPEQAGQRVAKEDLAAQDYLKKNGDITDVVSMTGGKPSIKPENGSKSGFGALSPENAKAAAARLVSGTDNPMQYSKYAWGSIAPYLPKDYNAAKSSADYNIAESGGKSFEKLYNTMSMAEERYDLNRKVTLSIADKINSDNAPLIQKAILTGQKDFGGNVEAAQIYATVMTTATEQAKLTTNNGMNGNLTDDARKTAMSIIDAAGTHGQMEGLIGDDGVLTKDAKNAMTSLDDTKSEIEKRLVQSSKGGVQGVMKAAGMGGQSQQQASDEDLYKQLVASRGK